MARERSITAFIVKRQDYGEADQIVTVFSKEEGKLRALVKAAKLPTSKLQPLMQPLFETRITLTGSSGSSGLSKVIGVQLVKAYSSIFESESKLGAWYAASELIIRALGDNAPNEALFQELQQYALFLHEHELSPAQVKYSSVQFQAKSLGALGLAIRTLPSAASQHEGLQIWFSLEHGGFSVDAVAGGIAVSAQTYTIFIQLMHNSYNWLPDNSTEDIVAGLATLPNLVNRFVTYQLEREIKSQRFLANT